MNLVRLIICLLVMGFSIGMAATSGPLGFIFWFVILVLFTIPAAHYADRI